MARPSRHVALACGTLAALACAALAALPACTSDNPQYDPAFGRSVDDAAAASPDLLAPPDLAVRPPDLLPPLLCGPGGAPSGARACSANLASSGTCKGERHTADRECPRFSQCQGGYCALPPPVDGSTQGKACASESQCFVSVATYSQSCVPFVVGATVELHCAETLGLGAAGESCKRAADCRSGFCLGSGTCFRACSADADCPLRAGVQLACKQVTLTVEGSPFTARSCAAP